MFVWLVGCDVCLSVLFLIACDSFVGRAPPNFHWTVDLCQYASSWKCEHLARANLQSLSYRRLREEER